MLSATDKEGPLVSICMLAYNIEQYIADAIEGVLAQKTSFPFELVIGEDCSQDSTRVICEEYQNRYPDLIRLLDTEINYGIAANYSRTWEHSRGKYIAICDGDDIWIDPNKLQIQVDILEKNEDYGAIFTDVDVVSSDRLPVQCPIHDDIRKRYAGGKVFFKLLHGNFINNSTAVFRKEILISFDPDRSSSNSIPDFLLWLHISTRSRIYFLDSRTTQYRKHSTSMTNTPSITTGPTTFQSHLPSILSDFDKYYKWNFDEKDRALIFRKLLSVIFHRNSRRNTNLKILKLLPKYFPGLKGFIDLLKTKVRVNTRRSPLNLSS